MCAAVLLLGYGRLLGFSGILVRATSPFVHARFSDLYLWRVHVLVGLLLGGVISQAFTAFPLAPEASRRSFTVSNSTFNLKINGYQKPKRSLQSI